MPIPAIMADLSTVAASNSPAGSESPISTDDFHRAIQAILRHTNAKGLDIASAATIDLGAATGEFVDVTGVVTITSLGTVAAGIVRRVRFTGALTLTHNATSLILPSSASIVTANGDAAEFVSLGTGNWKCTNFIRQTGAPLVISNGTITPAKLSTGAPTWNTAGEFTVTDPSLLGYGTGAGGAVTQLTSKATAVTLNKPTGKVTTAADALAAGAEVNFIVNNSLIAATDMIIINGNLASNYTYRTGIAAAGNFAIFVKNITAGSLSEVLTVNVAILKGVIV